MVDIRKPYTNLNEVIFADDCGGTGRCFKLEKGVGDNINMPARASGAIIHVKRGDIDNLIKALEYAKRHWG